MKQTLSAILVTFFTLALSAQPKDFEGNTVYKITVKSKNEGVSDKVWRDMLALGDSMTIVIRQGNYKQTTGQSEIYLITKDEKAYFKFKGIDTLYYLDYSSDTSSVLSVEKTDEKRNIAGYDCKVIVVKSPSGSRKYYYSPSVYMNPEYDKNNRIGRYDVFAKETSSLNFGYVEETDNYTLSQFCTRIEPGPVNNNVFDLPKLPQKLFTSEAISTSAKFPRTGGFEKYLQISINPDAFSKYIKIPKGEDMADQSAIVLFMINERGRVVNAQVINKSELHPKVAEEALRVVNASPPWTPASVLGEKVIAWYKMPITFRVSKK